MEPEPQHKMDTTVKKSKMRSHFREKKNAASDAKGKLCTNFSCCWRTAKYYLDPEPAPGFGIRKNQDPASDHVSENLVTILGLKNEDLLKIQIRDPVPFLPLIRDGKIQIRDANIVRDPTWPREAWDIWPPADAGSLSLHQCCQSSPQRLPTSS